MSDTDARLWHPWLHTDRVLGVMLHTRGRRRNQAPPDDVDRASRQ